MTNRHKLSLHIPVPRARPGDRPDFSHLTLPAPGATRCPDMLAAESDMRDLPYGLIRVLDEIMARLSARGIHIWRPDILRRGLRAMLLTRLFEERMFAAHRQGKTSFFMKSTGEEAIGGADVPRARAGATCVFRLTAWSAT